jgi:putative SOS response-associated peptidase YedK
MCGRYTVRSIQPVSELFGIALPPEFQPRFNIAPTQDVPVVRSASAPAAPNAKRADLLRWGLIPSWAPDPSIGNRMINARAETAAAKPAFRDAMRRRRCLVPADGFYEWQKLEGAKRKQPHLIRMKGDRPFAFAGLWDTWFHGADRIESFTILTTSPNEVIRSIHDRMPVIIAPADFDRWLDPKVDADGVADLLRPCAPDEMEATPVGTQVNNPKLDDPSCAEAWK